MSLRTKQSTASSGRAHDRLAAEVERRVEQDRAARVARSNSSSRRREPGRASAVDRLHAGRAVDVGDRRAGRAARRHGAGLQHEGRGVIEVEVLEARSARTAGANGRKASRFLTRALMRSRMLRVARVGQDRAAAERARPELHAAVKPADDLAARPGARRSLAAAPLRGRGSPGRGPALAKQGARCRRPANAGPRIDVPQRRGVRPLPVRRTWTRAAAPSAPPASPAAGWTNSRSKRALPDDAAVGDAVERHARPPGRGSAPGARRGGSAPSSSRISSSTTCRLRATSAAKSA